MRRVEGFSLWLGHLGDAMDRKALLDLGIEAVIDLAIEELPLTHGREMVFCRFPLMDGSGNPKWLLRTAVETLSNLLNAGVPTFVYCGAGMSRTPAVAAAAIAHVRNCSLDQALALVVQRQPADVSPALWADILAAIPDLAP